ncbi:MAG: thiolase family protein, partial [Phycisphaerales bacterium]|nr:thiolase family protein [Phycisphaerales bacterium]
MNNGRLVIVDGVRTPFSKMGTTLAMLGADELGRIAVSNLLAKTGFDPALVDEVILGCVGQPADVANVSRVIALRAGIPDHVPAITVHRNCASGFESVTVAQQKMSAGKGEVFIVGGTESMSQYPLLFNAKAVGKFAKLSKAKTMMQKLGTMASFRPSDFAPRIALLLGLKDPYCNMGMGQIAELIGREAGISREEQDRYALESHQKTIAARERLAEEICPVFVPPKYAKTMVEDNGPREEQSMKALAKLRPVFEKHTGTVTPGNSSQVTDGAVALLVMSEAKAEEYGLEPLGFLTGYSYAACDPARMGLGPVYAIARAEEEVGLGVNDADLIEINEAFAAQALYCVRELGIDAERVNVNGGAIALGHPLGCTGAKL